MSRVGHEISLPANGCAYWLQRPTDQHGTDGTGGKKSQKRYEEEDRLQSLEGILVLMRGYAGLRHGDDVSGMRAHDIRIHQIRTSVIGRDGATLLRSGLQAPQDGGSIDN